MNRMPGVQTMAPGKYRIARLVSPLIVNEPFEVNPKNLLDSILKANDLGREIASQKGDSAYRSIHNLKK